MIFWRRTITMMVCGPDGKPQPGMENGVVASFKFDGLELILQDYNGDSGE